MKNSYELQDSIAGSN